MPSSGALGLKTRQTPLHSGGWLSVSGTRCLGAVTEANCPMLIIYTERRLIGFMHLGFSLVNSWFDSYISPTVKCVWGGEEGTCIFVHALAESDLSMNYTKSQLPKLTNKLSLR